MKNLKRGGGGGSKSPFSQILNSPSNKGACLSGRQGWGIFRTIIISLFATLACVGIIKAATTIGNNISTTGTLTVGDSAIFSTASSTGIVKFFQINSDTGAISFGDENLSTTGTLNVSGLTTLGNASTTSLSISDTLTVSSGGIDVTGASIFNNNLTVNGLLGITDTLTVSSGGMDVTGDTTLTGNATVTNDLTVGGEFIRATDQSQYEFLGKISSMLPRCVLLFGWLNTGVNLTEVNQCGNGIADPANNEVGVYSSGVWNTARSSQGNGYVVTLDYSLESNIDIADDDDFSFGNSSTDSDFSIGYWVKPTNVDATKFLISKYDISGQVREWYVGIDNTHKSYMDIYDESLNNADTVIVTTAHTANTWHFIVFVYDDNVGVGGAGLRVYVNGVYNATGTNSTYIAMENLSTPVRIGSALGGALPADGSLGAVFITKDALTAGQIAALYNTGRSHYGL